MRVLTRIGSGKTPHRVRFLEVNPITAHLDGGLDAPRAEASGRPCNGVCQRALRSSDLKGSFTTTLTPAMTPVTARRTSSPAVALTSPAPLIAPLAAADAASSARS